MRPDELPFVVRRSRRISKESSSRRMRLVPVFIPKAPCKRTQHCWPITPKIVGCHMLRLFAHPFACCWMLMRVVAQSLKPVKLFSRQLPTFLLFRDRRSVAQQLMLDPFAQLFQHCWGHTRSLRMDYKDLWVVFFPRCTAGPKLVGSCCIRLHTTANTHATTPNIVVPTMLGVVAPVLHAA